MENLLSIDDNSSIPSVPPEDGGSQTAGRIIPTRVGPQQADTSGIEGGRYYEGDCFNLTRKFPMGIFDTVFMHPSYIIRRRDPAYGGDGSNPYDVHKILPEDRYWSRELLREYPEVHRICALLRDLYREDMMLWAVWLSWRIIDSRRILAQDGYLWLCCPVGMEHGIRLLLTVIFGNAAFDEILWACPKVDGRVYQIIGVKNDPSMVGISEPIFSREFLSVANINLSDWDRENARCYDLPVALMEHILLKQKGGNNFVLESFGGYGTFCRAAHKHKHSWIYAELNRRVSRIFIEEFAKPNGCVNLPEIIPLGDLQTLRKSIDDLVKCSLYLGQQGICPCCRAKYSFQDMTFDHIFPRSQGGPDDQRNLRLLCSPCNQKLRNSNIPDE